jgi:uncharacterized protein YjiS (DUF1127 family)
MAIISSAKQLFGGAGNDTMAGGPGADQLFGPSGDDILLGRGGVDLLFGGDSTLLDRHSARLGNWRTEFERIYAAPGYRRPRQARRNPKRASWLVELVAKAFDTVQQWHERAQSRRLLCSLDEHMRNDLGLSNADVAHETGKPFWQL